MPTATPTAANTALTANAQLGKAIFFDPNLSSQKNQSCAFCHSTDTGFTSPHEDFNATGAVVEGSVPGRFGNNKPPTISYASHGPVLHHRIEVDDETGESDLLFVGGAFYNGRATGKKLGNPVADQAQGPFLNPMEMALPDGACVVKRVCQPEDGDLYPVKMQDVWGAEVCDISFPATLEEQCANPDATITLPHETREKVEDAFNKLALSVAAYQHSHEVSPFTSKYDYYVRGEATLTAEEQRGLELFKSEKSMCAECHVLDRGPLGQPPLTTDFTYDNLGVPRNPDNPVYTAPSDVNPLGKAWVDRGLETFLASDPLYQGVAKDQLGKVKVPTLRNVDARPSEDFVKAYMHNGYFKSLKSVVHFYNTRDVKPRCQDPMTRESDALKQGCWPAPEVPENLNVDELGDLKLTEEEEWSLVAFMKTLTDGYVPAKHQANQAHTGRPKF